MSSERRASRRQEIDVKSRIEHALEELRVVVPGNQALLGFQFVVVFSSGFYSLSPTLKALHFASLLLVTLATVLLLAPAAHHRIAEEGRDSEVFHRFVSVMLLLSMATLALGISLELGVIGRVITGSDAAGAIVAAVALVVFLALWFGYALMRRMARAGPPPARGRQGAPESTQKA